ncbi:hypothetical protein [Lentzea cavernae]|uniref:hypothetical protein n=1 Tax=Lentzea cavernae TaxID=2020703 RepID=UPI0017484E08|nr:hypothetical protein [Lentzea cavernae]
MHELALHTPDSAAVLVDGKYEKPGWLPDGAASVWTGGHRLCALRAGHDRA